MSKIDWSAIGLGILLAGVGIGLCINFARQDPVISACEDAVDFVGPDSAQVEMLKYCLDKGLGEKP